MFDFWMSRTRLGPIDQAAWRWCANIAALDAFLSFGWRKFHPNERVAAQADRLSVRARVAPMALGA